MTIKIDDKGRFSIPKAIREMMGIKDKVKIRFDGKELIITKGE